MGAQVITKRIATSRWDCRQSTIGRLSHNSSEGMVSNLWRGINIQCYLYPSRSSSYSHVRHWASFIDCLQTLETVASYLEVNIPMHMCRIQLIFHMPKSIWETFPTADSTVLENVSTVYPPELSVQVLIFMHLLNYKTLSKYNSFTWQATNYKTHKTPGYISKEDNRRLQI